MVVESYPSTAHPTPASNTSWKPQRLRRAFGSWGLEAAERKASVLWLLGRTWTQFVRPFKFPPGLRPRRAASSGSPAPQWSLSAQVEANCEIFVPQVRGKWPSPGNSPGAQPKPVGGTSRGRRILLGQRKHTSALASSPPHFVQSSEVSKQFSSSGSNSQAKGCIFPPSLQNFHFLCVWLPASRSGFALGIKFSKFSLPGKLIVEMVIGSTVEKVFQVSLTLVFPQLEE